MLTRLLEKKMRVMNRLDIKEIMTLFHKRKEFSRDAKMCDHLSFVIRLLSYVKSGVINI